jgi:hypothetical protein
MRRREFITLLSGVAGGCARAGGGPPPTPIRHQCWAAGQRVVKVSDSPLTVPFQLDILDPGHSS